MTHNTSPKALTYDEKKAAEAAFAGRPFNDAWSESARAVYDGILKALPTAQVPALPSVDLVSESGAATELVESLDATDSEQAHETETVPTIKDREKAIQAGVLIDVTPLAQQLGLTFPVTVTKPLWEVGIVTTKELSEAEQEGRLRDILMAFRLRLASLATISPLFDFPALLTMPPATVPQPVPLFALIQPDAGNQANVTLLLPNEISLSILPSN
ncbi:MAG: DUF6573 family protein [Nitrospira sp.]